MESSLLNIISLIQLGAEETKRELMRRRPHILICSAEFLASDEVNLSHAQNISLYKCEKKENDLLNLICSDEEPLA